MTEKQTLSLKRKYLRKENANWPPWLASVPESKWPNLMLLRKPFAVWRSRYFMVQGFKESLGVIRLSINRCELDGDGGWSQDVTWEELMDLKRQAGYSDHDAVELFPRDLDIVNVANMRHLWVLPIPAPFGWRSDREQPQELPVKELP